MSTLELHPFIEAPIKKLQRKEKIISSRYIDRRETEFYIPQARTTPKASVYLWSVSQSPGCDRKMGHEYYARNIFFRVL